MTDREDSRSRPIFVHAILRAETGKEAQQLLAIVSSLLLHEKGLIPKWTTFFQTIFDGGTDKELPESSQLFGPSSSQESIGRFVYPREDLSSRELIAKRLRSGVNSNYPLAVGTTGRSGKGIFERVCQSQGNWQVAFFSSMCSGKAELALANPLPKGTGGLNTRVIAAAIGGAIVILIVAAIRSCSCRKGDGQAIGGTNVVGYVESGGIIAADSPTSGGDSEADHNQNGGRSDEFAGGTRLAPPSDTAITPFAGPTSPPVMSTFPSPTPLNKENK